MHRLGDLAAALGATLEAAPPEAAVTALAAAEEATAGQLCFVRPGAALRLASPTAWVLSEPGWAGACALRVPSLDAILPELLELFWVDPEPWGDALEPFDQGEASISAQLGAGVRLGPGARVGRGAVLEGGVTVGANAVIEGGAVLGAGTTVEASAVVGWGCRLGEGVFIGRGAVIGAEGFGYVPGPRGPRRLRHLGGVELGDAVSVGANSTICRGTLGMTRVGAGSKLDCLVHLAHNVQLGRCCLLAAQVGIAGSTRLGDGVQLGGQAGVVGHITLGAGARVAAQSGVVGAVKAGATLAGTPAVDLGRWRQASALLARLPELARRLRALERAAGGAPQGEAEGGGEG